MIISTNIAKPFSIRFMIFNFISFAIFNIKVLKNITEFGSKKIVLIILISVITSIAYIFLSIKFTRLIEGDVIKTSYYDKDYMCHLFNKYDTELILEVKDGKCNIYIHEMYIMFLYCKYDLTKYLNKVKSRIFNLDKKDMLCIYCYKYFSNILLSMVFFLVWNVCNITNNGKTFFNNFAMIVIFVFVSMCIYFFVNEIFSRIIIKIMKKRNLGFLIYK